MRGDPSWQAWGGRRSPARRPCSSARRTSAGCSRRSSATSTACTRCRRASTSRSGAPRAARRGARRARRGGTRATRRTPATRASGCPTRATPSGSPTFLAGDEPTVVYFGKLLHNKGVHVLLEALRERRRAGGDRRLRRLPRASWRSAPARADALHRAARAPPPRAPARRSPTSTVVPSIFPEAFGMVAAEAAAAGSPPLVARHSGLAEVAAGLEEEYPPHLRRPGALRDGRRRRARDKLQRAARAAAGRPRGARARPPAAPRSSAGAGRASPRRLAGTASTTLPRMGDAQRLPYDELLRTARERFDERQPTSRSRWRRSSRCSTRRRSTSSTASRRCRRRRRGHRSSRHLVGELIASEVEIKTGRCETFADVPAADGRAARAAARRSSSRWASRSARRARIRGPLAGPADHRHAALPPQRRAPPLRRLAQQHASGSTSTSASAAPTARSRSCNGLRSFLPELLALSASSPFVEGVNTGLHSARTQIFTRFFPRCGVPDAYGGWDEYEHYVRFLYETGSIDEHTQLWWSVRPHLALPDGRDPDLRRAARPGRGAGARGVRVALAARIARAARRGRAAARPAAPADRGEHVAGDPLRPLRRADRPRARRASCRRARGSSALLEWVRRSPTRSARRRTSRFRERNAAERQIARADEGATFEQIYSGAGRSAGPRLTSMS